MSCKYFFRIPTKTTFISTESWKKYLLIRGHVVFLFSFDTYDVVRSWSIFLLPFIVLDNLFDFLCSYDVCLPDCIYHVTWLTHIHFQSFITVMCKVGFFVLWVLFSSNCNLSFLWLFAYPPELIWNWAPLYLPPLFLLKVACNNHKARLIFSKGLLQLLCLAARWLCSGREIPFLHLHK